MSLSVNRFRMPRVVLATVGALLGLAVLASGAQAACSYPDAEQVFARWQDEAYYQLAPDGGLEEGGTGWTFEGGAQLVEGNEDYHLNGAEDVTSLSVPFGGIATSPPVCVDDTTPTFRVMVRNMGAWYSRLRVTVTYQLPNGVQTRVTDIRASNSWEPSEPLVLETNGEAERVARISFAPRDPRGAWLLDDLYIDPFARR